MPTSSPSVTPTTSATRNGPIGGLRDLLREFVEGGVMITDPLAPLGQADQDQIGFRTLVQADGDFCVSIHAQALASPDFLAAHARHLAHVRSVLTTHTNTLRRWVRVATVASGVIGFAVIYAASADLATMLIEGVYAQVVSVATATIGGALFSLLARSLVRWLIRKNLIS